MELCVPVDFLPGVKDCADTGPDGKIGYTKGNIRSLTLDQDIILYHRFVSTGRNCGNIYRSVESHKISAVLPGIIHKACSFHTRSSVTAPLLRRKKSPYWFLLQKRCSGYPEKFALWSQIIAPNAFPRSQADESGIFSFAFLPGNHKAMAALITSHFPEKLHPEDGGQSRRYCFCQVFSDDQCKLPVLPARYLFPPGSSEASAESISFYGITPHMELSITIVGPIFPTDYLHLHLQIQTPSDSFLAPLSLPSLLIFQRLIHK